MNSAVSDLQPELELRLQAARSVNADAVQELCGLLRGRGWATARDLRALRPAWTERFIRAVANASKGHVISGQQGYALTGERPRGEGEHAASWMEHQANEMRQRAVEIRRVLHRYPMPQPQRLQP